MLNLCELSRNMRKKNISEKLIAIIRRKARRSSSAVNLSQEHQSRIRSEINMKHERKKNQTLKN